MKFWWMNESVVVTGVDEMNIVLRLMMLMMMVRRLMVEENGIVFFG